MAEGHQTVLLLQLQGVPDQLQIGLDLAFFQLVQLVGHDHHRASGAPEPLEHGHVVRRGLVPGVHNENTQGDEARLLEIRLHQPSPAVPLLLADFGIAVAGQIGQIHPVVDEEIVHLGGLAGGGAHPGEVLPVEQAVDDGGFAHVGSPGKGHLGPSVPDKGLRAHRRADKFRLVIVDRHGKRSSFTLIVRRGIPPIRGHGGRRAPRGKAPAPPQTPGPRCPPG